MYEYTNPEFTIQPNELNSPNMKAPVIGILNGGFMPFRFQCRDGL